MPIDAAVETFDDLVSNGNVLVDFWGPRCQPCLQMMPTVERLEQTSEGRLAVVKVNASEHRELCRSMGVMSLPTYIFMKNGDEIERLTGSPTETDIMHAAEQLTNDNGGDT